MKHRYEIPQYTFIARRSVTVKVVLSTYGDSEFAWELAQTNDDWDEIGEPEFELFKSEVEMVPGEPPGDYD